MVIFVRSLHQCGGAITVGVKEFCLWRLRGMLCGSLSRQLVISIDSYHESLQISDVTRGLVSVRCVISHVSGENISCKMYNARSA